MALDPLQILKNYYPQPTSMNVVLSAFSEFTVTSGSSEPSPFMIDDLGLTLSSIHGAWSFRKLRSAYSGACIRVREAGGSTGLDIGFDENGYIDLSAIVAHCSGNIGYIAIHYDQGLSGSHRVSLSSTADPVIYDGSSFFLYGTNQKAGQRIRSSLFTRYSSTTNRVNVADNHSISVMLVRETSASVQYTLGLEYGGGSTDMGPVWDSNGAIGWVPGNPIDAYPVDTSNVFGTSSVSGIFSIGCYATTTSSTVYIDSTLIGNKARIGYSAFWGGNPWYVDISDCMELEAIITNSSLGSSMIQSISDHRKTYWGV